MAFRSTITLTDKDQKIFDQFKKELGIESSSQAVATAIQIAEYFRETSKTGKKVLIKDEETGEIETLKIIGM